MRSWLFLGPMQLLIAGCSSIVFTNADRDRVQTVEMGSRFSISLSSEEHWRNPKLRGAVLEFLSHSYQEPTGPHVFEFRADRAGETQIRIPAHEGLDSPEDFILRVKVVDPMLPFVAR